MGHIPGLALAFQGDLTPKLRGSNWYGRRLIREQGLEDRELGFSEIKEGHSGWVADLLGKGTGGGLCSGDHEKATPGGERIHRSRPSCMASNAKPVNRELSLQPPGAGRSFDEAARTSYRDGIELAFHVRWGLGGSFHSSSQQQEAHQPFTNPQPPPWQSPGLGKGQQNPRVGLAAAGTPHPLQHATPALATRGRSPSCRTRPCWM